MPYIFLDRWKLALIEKGLQQVELERVVKVLAYFEAHPLKLSYHKE